MLGVAPILPSQDLAATAAFYSRLGFEQTGLWPDEYLVVNLYVEDPDALFAEWDALALPREGIPRLQGPPEDSDYGLREFAVVDPDGNLLRIGSFVREPPSGSASSDSPSSAEPSRGHPG